ncbi:tetratricopeptide repeat protein [bacterium]|nr:MAG: tetratricopeptide repeat protein [bacterium]
MLRAGLLLALLSAVPLQAQTPAEDARSAASEGRYADAAARFKEALRLEPKNASLHLGLGLALQALKDFPKAAAALEEAAKLGPDAPAPYYSLGLLYEAAASDPAAFGEPKTEAVQRRYRHKALKAWERFLKTEKDSKRLEAGRAHLERVKEELR